MTDAGSVCYFCDNSDVNKLIYPPPPPHNVNAEVEGDNAKALYSHQTETHVVKKTTTS